jgi:hypothetical protein
MNHTRIPFALSAAVAIGVLIGDSAAHAGSKDDGESGGGFVVPGNLDGVNPAYHPDIFGNPSVARAYGFVPSARARGFVPGAGAYDFFQMPSQMHTPRHTRSAHRK